MSVTAVLLNYRRPTELAAIIENLKSYSFIKEVLVHDNSGTKNVINYGRYLAASKAKYPIIYTQDDDCIVKNLVELYRRFDGTQLVNGLKRHRMSSYQGKDTMLGWGAFFRVEWTYVLQRYIARFDEDYLFYRETDRIFTSLLEVPKLTLEAEIVDFPSARSMHSLSFQPEHEEAKRLALDRCHELGLVIR